MSLFWRSLLVSIGRSMHMVGRCLLAGDPLRSTAHRWWGGEGAPPRSPYARPGAGNGDEDLLVRLSSSLLPPLELASCGQRAPSCVIAAERVGEQHPSAWARGFECSCATGWTAGAGRWAGLSHHHSEHKNSGISWKCSCREYEKLMQILISPLIRNHSVCSK